jgi:endonuclease-3
VREICLRLDEVFPDAHCALVHEDPLQLLIATILSAQCTDRRVNEVTPALFREYPDAAAFAQAEQGALEEAIRSTGFFRNKANNIRACCRRLVEQHSGSVPRTMEELVALPGVGRKTANVVLGNAFDVQVGVVVDTHVGRISQRLALSRHSDPVKIEQDLMKLVPKERWTLFSHQVIFHGRQTCTARAPKCGACALRDLCPNRRD